MHLSPQFMALLVGLITYTGAFIADVVRAGIQSVQPGQVEAARALRLGDLDTLRAVVFPQALRVIIPPLISQYLNLTKNSSLAIAICYPDLFSVGRIMLNQAGRAIPRFCSGPPGSGRTCFRPRTDAGPMQPARGTFGATARRQTPCTP